MQESVTRGRLTADQLIEDAELQAPVWQQACDRLRDTRLREHEIDLQTDLSETGNHSRLLENLFDLQTELDDLSAEITWRSARVAIVLALLRQTRAAIAESLAGKDRAW